MSPVQVVVAHSTEPATAARYAARPSRAYASRAHSLDSTFDLTPRETEVLAWISKGKSNFEIGAILGISAWTVKIHVGRILSKLNASTRGHAIAKAMSAGLVTV